ncbi:hypothetical protein CONPUDRAFT_40430, partial [Coniophora puteana RWD-64-598 SS2]
ETERREFFERHGVRWTELARLPYFDLVRQSIIDPMHNLILGIVKTQWYDRWIKTSTLRASTTTQTRELDILHKFLAKFEVPSWTGKLPPRVGEPAGGSLTADEYKFATTVAWPIMVSALLLVQVERATLTSIKIPILWDLSLDEARAEHQTSLNSYPARLDKYEKELAMWKAENPAGSSTTGKRQRKGKSEPSKPQAPRLRMQADEPANFLRLSCALKLFCSSSLYGTDALKPNFHWAVHLSDQIRDFGPVYNFWAFLSERLNKVLKSFNVNNWTGGQVEISMMREFSR